MFNHLTVRQDQCQAETHWPNSHGFQRQPRLDVVDTAPDDGREIDSHIQPPPGSTSVDQCSKCPDENGVTS